MKLERLLAIVVLLLNRGRVTAKELAEYFEVSTRTIYRDIETINQAGIPIVTYQGNNGGLGIMENYKVDRHLLTPEEMRSIIIALQGFNTTLEDRKLNDITEKMRGLITRAEQDEIHRQNEQLVVDFSPWGNNKEVRDKVNLIRHAIERNKLIEFSYTDMTGGVQLRAVEPMTLLLKGYSWYLHGYCQLRNDYRLFRVSRMRGLQALGETFIRREKSFEGWSWEFGERTAIELVLKFSPRVRARVEDYFTEENIEVQPDGSLLVHVRWSEDEWVYGMVLSYGKDVEVLEPPHVRQIVWEKARAILQNYAADVDCGHDKG